MGDRFFVVPSSGHFGDRSVVVSSHCTLEAAHRACKAGFEVRVGGKRKGEAWLRSATRVYSKVNFETFSVDPAMPR